MSIFDSPSSGGSGVNDIFGSNSNPFDGSSFGSQVFSAPPVKLSAWTRWTNIGLISLSAFGWIPIFLNWGTDYPIRLDGLINCCSRPAPQTTKKE